MAIYSYVKTVITGALGTVYDLQTNDKVKYRTLGVADNGRTYISLKDISHLQTQLKEIDFKEDVLPDDLLQTIKSKRLLELTELGRAYDNELVNNDMVINSSLGFKVNADLRSQNNLRGLIDFMTDTETASYIDYNNKAHDLSKSQLETLLKELVLNGSNLYKQKWNYSKQIENATNSDDDTLLQEFNFTMLNFGEWSWMDLDYLVKTYIS